MTELTVIVPTADNDGKTLQPVIDRFEGFLLDTVGGFSRDAISGAWKDETGKIYRDTSYRYTVSGDRVDAVQSSLPTWCEELRQLCLYASTREVHVTFVDPVAA